MGGIKMKERERGNYVIILSSPINDFFLILEGYFKNSLRT